MSSKGAADVRVVFKDDDSQDTLLYTGDRVVEPCNCAVINAAQSNVSSDGDSSFQLWQLDQLSSSLVNAAQKNNASSDKDTSFQLRYHHPLTISQTLVTGTLLPFNVVNGTDSMDKNGITTCLSIRHQCLTVMDFYANKSIEELRLEDYINSNLAIGKEVSDLFKPSSVSSSSSSSSSSFSSSASLSSTPLPSFPVALESLETLPRSSSMQCSSFSANIFSGSFDSSKLLRRVSKKTRRTAAMKRTVSNLSSNKTITARSTTDAPCVLPKTASQTSFTPNVIIPQATSPNTLFTLTPNISFTSESNPACVFTAAQTHATERQKPTALSISEAKHLRDALLGSIVKCTQIQNSLYRLLLLKLQACITGPSDTGVEYSDESASLPKTSGMEKAEEECVLNGAQLANIDSKHTKSTAVCLDNITSECDTLGATGGLDDAVKISDVRGIGVRKNVTADTLRVDKTGMNSSKASSTVENPHSFTQAAVVENADYDVCSDAASTSSVYSKDVAAIDASKAANTENVEKCLNGAPLTLLCELQNPLNALIRCADIQRELFQRMMSMSELNTKEASNLSAKESSPRESKELYTNRKVDMREVQSKLEAITFKTKMECSYARDPFSSKHLKPSTSEDLLQHIPPHRHVSILGGEGGDSCSLRELPHGRGILKTATGEFIYSGDWCRGKRHGKGEGLIFPAPGSNHSAAAQGFYIGGWRHNMRHGHGQMIFTSDAMYEGQWQFDKMTGYGTLKLPDGTIQEGTWKEGSLQGCALFTWPHGVTEYREYDAIRGQLSSCKLDQEFAEELTQMSCIRSQLLNLRDCAVTLKDEKISLTEEVNNLKMEHAEMVDKLQDFDLEIYRKYEQQWKRDSQKQRDEFEKLLKDAESKATGENDTLKKELEESKAALLCQICFVRKRDCIILPCSHLLYCRQCVHEHKNNGNSRCPTCRGPINSEILCNINHSP